MRKAIFAAVLVCLLLLSGCSAATQEIFDVSGAPTAPETQIGPEAVETVSFVSGMGCSDETCTLMAHHHRCAEDCPNYSHYHNCPLDCTMKTHHHTAVKRVMASTGNHTDHHEDSHH